jgi:2-polyprenyl-3-methyl-5-hydroxy-6-metoxy-1,4-benzoquinol methylase
MTCPACKKSDAKLVEETNTAQEMTQDILPEKYRIYRCGNCHLHFKDYIPDAEMLKKFYNSLGDGVWEYNVEYPHESFLKSILRDMPDGASVLDVGCNTGRLLQNETERLQCYGVELNKEAAKVAASRGIRIIESDGEAGNIGEGKFDLVTLIDVFEHLNDPMPFIQRLVSALKPGGALYIFTGRTDCLPANLCGPAYWYYKPAQHLIFLNRRFINWFKKNNRNLKVSMKPMRHFDYSLRKSFFEISWHIVWHYFSPNSPYKVFGLKKLARMKEPFMITSWRDHLFFVINKK